MNKPKIVITEFGEPIIFIYTLEELLSHLKEKTKHFTHPIVRLTPEIIEWFNSLQEPFYIPKGKYARFHTVIWKEVYGKEEWFSSQIIRANLNSYYYYIRGYTEDEAKVLMEEMRKKNSEAVKRTVSSFSPEERKAKYGSFSDEYLKKKYGERWKEVKEKHYKEKRLIPIQIEYWLRKGYSLEEAEKKVREEQSKRSRKGLSNPNRKKRLLPMHIDYWLAKGYSFEEAKKKVADFQRRDLEFFIRKYGKEEGYKKWKERNEKWAKTMSQKENVIPYGRDDEYIGFSKISQQLFDKVVQRLAEYFPMGVMGIQYATFKNGKKVQAKHYMENEKRFGTKFVDFYDEISNVVIEFDGTEFHDDPERDLKRLEEIYNTSKSFILRIPEDLLGRVGLDKLAKTIADYLIKVRNYGFKETENSNRIAV